MSEGSLIGVRTLFLGQQHRQQLWRSRRARLPTCVVKSAFGCGALSPPLFGTVSLMDSTSVRRSVGVGYVRFGKPLISDSHGPQMVCKFSVRIRKFSPHYELLPDTRMPTPANFRMLTMGQRIDKSDLADVARVACPIASRTHRTKNSRPRAAHKPFVDSAAIDQRNAGKIFSAKSFHTSF